MPAPTGAGTGTGTGTGTGAAAASALSLPSFLERAWEGLLPPAGTAPGAGRYHVTLGNEAGDADSIVSALVHGLVLDLEGGDADGGEGADGALIVPLVGIPRADLPLRRETTLLLGMAGVDVGRLLCLDGPPPVPELLSPATAAAAAAGAGAREGGTPPELRVTLLDHNRIRPPLAHLSGSVVEILDHHEDEGDHPHVEGEARQVAFEGRSAAVGSACTLVAERLMRAYTSSRTGQGPSSGPSSGHRPLDPSASLALLGVILLDTMDMSEEAGKGTGRDLAAIEGLLERTDWGRLDHASMDGSAEGAVFDAGREHRPDRAALHGLLSRSKFDPAFWAEMSAWDCLRIDHKRFEPGGSDRGDRPPVPFGMASVLLPLSEMASKPDFAESVRRWLLPSEDGGACVPLLVVLSMTLVDGKPRREMLLAGPPDLVDSAADYLVGGAEASFLEIAEEEDMVPEVEGNAEGLRMRAFRQGNPKGSRKQVAPVLLKFAASL